MKIFKTLFLVLSLACFTCWGQIFADELEKADSAVANILFEYEGAEEFASYKVSEDGFVDIIFARNTPDKLYSEILTRLQNHPDIKDVLSGKGGPVCRLF